jgi:phage tail-like protein
MRTSTSSAWRRAWLAALAVAMLGANIVQAQNDSRGDALARPFSFRVEIEGLDAGVFRSVSGLSIETEVIEFREGGSDVIHKLPGARKYPNLVLKRGFTGDTTLYDWYNSFTGGNPARVNGSIIMLGPDLAQVARWEFHNGFPVKVEGPDLDASSNEVPIETIEIAHEGLTMVTRRPPNP